MALTREQQRDYLRRLQIGWAAASADQAQGARDRTEAEKGMIADQLQLASDSLINRHDLPPPDPEHHGLVIQQRLFSRLHSR